MVSDCIIKHHPDCIVKQHPDWIVQHHPCFKTGITLAECKILHDLGHYVLKVDSPANSTCHTVSSALKSSKTMFSHMLLAMFKLYLMNSRYGFFHRLFSAMLTVKYAQDMNCHEIICQHSPVASNDYVHANKQSSKPFPKKRFKARHNAMSLISQNNDSVFMCIWKINHTYY